MQRAIIFTLLLSALGCPYLGGKGQVDTPVVVPVLEMYLGSQGGITGGALPSLPSAHQKYSSSDLPSLVTCVLDTTYTDAVQKLSLNPKLAAEQVDDGGYSSLQWAAMLGANIFIELYHNHGVSVNSMNSKYPPLHLAVMQNHSHTVELLLRLGAQSTLRSAKGLTPFLHAVDEGHVVLASMLLAAGGNVNDRVTDSPMQIPALGFAAMRGEANLVELLLRRGADRGLPSAVGHTPLIFAAAANHLSVVNLLLEEPFRNNSADATTVTKCPVSFATECHINDKENGKGRSALMWAVTGDPSGRRVTVHRSAGRPKAPGYNPPLDPPLSAEQEKVFNARQVQLVERLLIHGSDPNAVDRAGQTALYLAATEEFYPLSSSRSHGVAPGAPWPVGRPDLVESLLRGGAVPRTTKDDMGRATGSQRDSEAAHMIQWAVERNYHEILRLILFPPPHVPRMLGEQEAGVALDLFGISARNGVSLLEQALHQKSWEVAELLVLRGCERQDGVNGQPLFDAYREQLRQGAKLSADQISVYLTLNKALPVVCAKIRYNGLGSEEIRKFTDVFQFINLLQLPQKNNQIASDAWVLLQSLLGTTGMLSRLWSLLS